MNTEHKFNVFMSIWRLYVHKKKKLQEFQPAITFCSFCSSSVAISITDPFIYYKPIHILQTQLKQTLKENYNPTLCFLHL